ncbi:MFS transporter [Nocardia transvalensis]|uniref:MFS transporter n=1 Tax=Nocardia transvalensis TaxID=37333 RepID=UPI001893F3E3|nr:MFS transporter [Nocardia transvalensis]MBF6329868.1 MFS transporter [Nocardia transvalensis]
MTITDLSEERVRADPRRWVALAVLLAAAFMDSVDVTVVHMAIPSLQHDLGATSAQVQWITGGYALAFALGLITGGRLGDMFGRKRLVLIGIALFTASSLLCGVATGPEMLLIGRIVQGAAAALMVPQVLSIAHVTFAETERSKVFGIYGAVLGLGTVAGPLISAALVEANLFGLHWRPIFLVNLPLGVAGLVVGALVIRESKADHATKPDPVGVALLTAGLFGLMLPLTQGRELDWPAWSIAMLIGSVPVLAVFVGYERWLARRGGQPLVPLSLFRAPSFSGGLSVQLCFGLASGVFFLAWTLYLQLGLGWSPIKAGLAGLPMSLALMVGAGVSAQVLVPRFGRIVLQIGGVFAALGAVVYHAFATHNGTGMGILQTMIPILLMGIGFGLIIAPLADLTLATAPNENAGAASGLLNTAVQLGQALGIGISSLVFFGRLDAGHGMPAAFGYSLWYVAAAFVLAILLLFALPKKGRSKIGHA